MPIDASIYGNLKPVEMPSMLDSQAKAMSLSQMAMQQKSMQRDDAFKAQKQRVSLIGNELEALAGMDPADRPAAYLQSRDRLLQSGLVQPQELPEQHDDRLLGQWFSNWRNSDEYLERQLTKAKIDAAKSGGGHGGGDGRDEYYRTMAEKTRREMAAGKPTVTEAQKTVDREYGKQHSEWVLGGGRADAEKGLAQLREAAGKLKGGFSTIGPVAGRVVPDFVSPGRTSVREAVEEVVQRNLRSILGAQFTEKEGERLIARAYNEKLSPDENLKRINRLAAQMRAAMEARDDAARYFDENGTLVGYKGRLPSVGAFADMEPSERGGSSGSAYAGQGNAKPNIVYQNGHRYELNPETGQYE